MTSYNGMVYFGINADRDAMSDVEVLPTLLRESLDELLDARSNAEYRIQASVGNEAG